MATKSGPDKLRLKKGDKIVCEGDSATSRRGGPSLDDWAYLRLMNWHESWASVLGELLFCWWPELCVKVRNAAVGGSSCHRIAARLETMVLPQEPDWVIMTTGGNDLRLGIDPGEFKAVLGDYATRLNEECGTRTIFLGSWSEAPGAPAKMKLARIKPHYDALCALAEERDYVEALILGPALNRHGQALAEQWEGHTIFSGPDGHYNSVGNHIIAAEVMRAFGLIAPENPY